MARKKALEDRKAEGGRQISASLKADEVALLDELKARFPGVSQKDLLVKAMKSLDGQNQTDWPAELRRLAAELEGA